MFDVSNNLFNFLYLPACSFLYNDLLPLSIFFPSAHSKKLVLRLFLLEIEVVMIAVGETTILGIKATLTYVPSHTIKFANVRLRQRSVHLFCELVAFLIFMFPSSLCG